MLKGWEKETQELSSDDLEVIVPLVVAGLRTKIGKETAISNSRMCKGVNAVLQKRGLSIKVKEPKMRKIIGYLRKNPFMDGFQILANNSGYWMSNDKSEIVDYVRSLESRSREINRTAKAMKETLMTHEMLF